MTDNQPRILIIDDEESMRFFLEKALTRSGYSVETAAAGEEGLERFAAGRHDLVITDLKMPDLDGLEVLARVKSTAHATPVVMITGFGTIDNAVEAMKRGAADYLTKPFEARAIRAVVKRVLGGAAAARAEEPVLVGDSAGIAAVRDAALKLADTDVTVLIHGESGTGKELVARAIHHGGARRSRPFIPVHCAALPPTLLEAELFGYVSGAFTGAVRDHRGLAERAEDGTLFLDEVGDIPLPVQAKLLRLLQENEIHPLGSEETVPLRARVIAATHRHLADLVESGDFREDLYYRLNVVPVTVPPLRARPDDVAPLLEHFLARANRAFERAVEGFTPAACAVLAANRWPGNVRELANLVERLVATREGGPVDAGDLPAGFTTRPAGASPPVTPATDLPYDEARRSFERAFFAHLLEETHGNVSEAARRAGISRPNLYRRLKETGLDAGDFKARG